MDRRRLLKAVRKKQFEFVGHITRTEGLERNWILGGVGGAKSRERQRIKYMDALVTQLGDGWMVVDLVRLADGREIHVRRRHLTGIRVQLEWWESLRSCLGMSVAVDSGVGGRGWYVSGSGG